LKRSTRPKIERAAPVERPIGNPWADDIRKIAAAMRETGSRDYFTLHARHGPRLQT
jgi:hypothetical protein